MNLFSCWCFFSFSGCSIFYWRGNWWWWRWWGKPNLPIPLRIMWPKLFAALSILNWPLFVSKSSYTWWDHNKCWYWVSWVNVVNSKTEGIHVGVPQSSCLGPLLFLICINDLRQAVQNAVVSMNANITSVCYQSSDISVLNDAINNNLKQLDTGFKAINLFKRCENKCHAYFH